MELLPPIVSVIRCPSYERVCVENALQQALSDIGGLQNFIRPGMRVLLKVNLVVRRPPEAAATTHPSLVTAMARAVRACGATPVICDSPGGLFTALYLRGFYDTCGMRSAALASGAVLNADFGWETVPCPEGVSLQEVDILSAVLRADAVISMGKLKTHTLCGFTGAVKNLFGTVPGMRKTEYHYRFPDLGDFANMLVDVAEYVHPVLSVTDAVTVMDGDGPSFGRARPLGALIVSANMHAADLAAVAAAGIPPENAPTLRAAIERGLCPPNLAHVRLRGEAPERFRPGDFKNVRLADNVAFAKRLPGAIQTVIKRLLRPRPVFDSHRCVRCGKCAQVCPMKAITVGRVIPRVNSKLCISCFCCAELCPHGAVSVRHSPLCSATLGRREPEE